MSEAVAAAIAGGLINSAGQLYANYQNLKANDDRFGAEVELANTAHRREVQDLIAAGLNPILSASGSGASVPQLSSGTVGNVAEELGNQVSSAGRLAALDIPLKESQVALNSAQAQNLHYDGVLKAVQADAVRRGMDTVKNSAGAVGDVANSVGEWFGDKLGEIYQGYIDDVNRIRQKGSATPPQVRHWSPKPVESPVKKSPIGQVRPSYVPLSQRKYIPLSQRKYIPLSERRKK